MKNFVFRSATALLLAAGLAACNTPAASTPTAAQGVEIQQIRNATLKIDYNGKTFLIDPMLAKKGAYPGFPGTYRSELRNPLIELPMPAEEVMKADAVIVTHTHLDHWDDAAQSLLPKNMPIFAQHEADAQLIRSQGFTNVRVYGDNTEFGGVRISRTGGQHGTDAMYQVKPLADLLGEASGIVFQAPGHKTVYLVGDTIWRPEVDAALATFKPDVIILNTGYAKVDGFDNDSIIMGKDDVARAYRAAPDAVIITTHMDAVNHAALSRAQLRDYVKEKGLQNRVLVPADGQSYRF
ncbi:MBL fold metallo-hydrolase [Uruburuella testudinis]|uniref:MBL fold metallo-hydrolase n=1 Tax=Uruburuella testudinis TaxID=1282863 RepID=A0ABY4DUL5_9NEIS|nr:MBL fold metallo-hydrolase [Uruburuella testudinis]UOO82730.1 MBL fold metallo-hydrolase [Uruburuella testudinis]